MLLISLSNWLFFNILHCAISWATLHMCLILMLFNFDKKISKFLMIPFFCRLCQVVRPSYVLMKSSLCVSATSTLMAPSLFRLANSMLMNNHRWIPQSLLQTCLGRHPGEYQGHSHKGLGEGGDSGSFIASWLLKATWWLCLTKSFKEMFGERKRGYIFWGYDSIYLYTINLCDYITTHEYNGMHRRD